LHFLHEELKGNKSEKSEAEAKEKEDESAFPNSEGKA
jgi:hypothetical protein